MVNMGHHKAFTAILILSATLFLACQVEAKKLGFRDPHTNYYYTLTPANITRITPGSPDRSLISVTRFKLNDLRQQVGPREFVQTVKFTPTLVDFDLQCSLNHCYMVAITSKTKGNVELYGWQRTQFDLLATKDSFALPHAVKLIEINSGFYIAIAQDQHHLSPVAAEDDGPKFMGCAVLKFVKNREHDVKYHQFIKLQFNPRHVNYFTSINTNNLTDPRANLAPLKNHHLVFSAGSSWGDESAENASPFIWSPLNDYFWPYRFPRGATVVESEPGTEVLKFPEPRLMETVNSTNPWRQQDGQTEICFYQLQRLLSDRDLDSRRLIDSSKSVWRAQNQNRLYAQHPGASLTNISAKVVVHGNVIVRGSIIDNPQVSLIANNHQQAIQGLDELSHLINSHSPTVVDNNIKQALFKLNHIREKISRAVQANAVGDGTFYNQIRFLGGIHADEIIFSGIANSDVRLNGIPFQQLENELVSLIGAQDIAGRIVFAGKVVADRLEIHGRINDHYYLKDAIDITSDRMQIIETSSLDYVMQAPGLVTVDFNSISAPDVILAHNATINSIRLNDFITRDNRTQVIVGRKTFKSLSVSKLNLAHQSVLLNGVNISRIAQNAIRLKPDPRGAPYQTITTNRQASFLKTIRVNRLSINSLVNQHINMTSLIHDSIKTQTYETQQIFGRKNFLSGLKIDRLDTDGALNGIRVGQIFNLNSFPPIAQHLRLSNLTSYNSPQDVPITGEFQFQAPVRVFGRVDANLVNRIDLTRRAVRRLPHDVILPSGEKPQLKPQLVRGHKTFYRPLRIINDIRLIDPQQAMSITNSTSIPYPLINGIDLGKINSNLKRLRDQPPPIFVENLNIEGNLDVIFQTDRNGPSRATFGNYSICPLDLIRSRAMLAGAEDQVIQTPLSIKSLRAKAILVDPNAFNGYNFPNDFVLRTAAVPSSGHAIVEPVYGVKTIERLVISPSFATRQNPAHILRLANMKRAGVVLERGVSVNQVPWSELQTFMVHERNLNSTGEKVFNTINVYGNLYVKRINDHYWPDDILLRSVSSTPGPASMPLQHKRIYTHLIFTNTSNLNVENQLVLRGPIQLNGRMNGVNLTEFSRRSATYGDKDLFSNGRPIKYKTFIGGLTVRGEVRSQGLIDGVNFDDMKRRVVTIAPNPKEPIVITSPKMFMSDVVFDAPIRMIYLNEMPMDNYLSRIRFEPDGSTLKIHHKKTITGALRINRNLYVSGLINGIDFSELKARAISLAPTDQELAFNKTLIVEGDVFMDNLWIDERNGTIDGVKLKNLLPIGPLGGNEFVLSEPRVVHQPTPYGRVTQVQGSLMDCQVKCEVQPIHLHHQPPPISSARSFDYTLPSAGPIVMPAQPVMAYTSRPAMHRPGNNYSVTRTTPPYSLASNYQPPFRLPASTSAPSQMPVLPANLEGRMQRLAYKTPVSIRYEQKHAPTRGLVFPERVSNNVDNQLESLRRQIISINLIRLNSVSDLVIGFIDAPSNDVSGYTLSEQDLDHFDHMTTHPRSYLQLDQIDFKIMGTTHHLSVGVTPNKKNENMTTVFSSLRGNNLGNNPGQMSVLPVEYPNSAMFIDLPDINTLFLLISQDQPMGSAMCPTTGMIHSFDRYVENGQGYNTMSQLENGIHVYIFQAFKPNSTSHRTAYFDLYQTINLDGVDNFEKFTFRGSSYVLAISRASEKIYLLMLRGYTGFQVVSWIDAPMVESVRVMYSDEKKPVLDISQTSGMHRIMESVVI